MMFPVCEEQCMWSPNHSNLWKVKKTEPLSYEDFMEAHSIWCHLCHYQLEPGAGEMLLVGKTLVSQE